MAKYIEQEAAIESVQEKLRICEALPNDITKAAAILTLENIQDSLESIPAADVRPVVRGKWEHFGSDVFRCSECGYGILPWNVGVNFCPNCGAMMEES